MTTEKDIQGLPAVFRKMKAVLTDILIRLAMLEAAPAGWKTDYEEADQLDLAYQNHNIIAYVYLPTGRFDGQTIVVSAVAQIYIDTDEEFDIFLAGSDAYILGFSTAGSATLVWSEAAQAWYVVATTGSVALGLPGN